MAARYRDRPTDVMLGKSVLIAMTDGQLSASVSDCERPHPADHQLTAANSSLSKCQERKLNCRNRK